MNILGIDTATAASAACVLRSDGEAFEVEPAPERLVERPAHAAELMPAVARCLADAELEWGELHAIAVGIGPGAFTGLRIGVATARGLAQSLEIGLRPVSSLAALAAGSPVAGNGAGPDRPTLALIDARRGELFAALYDGRDERWEPFAATPEEVVERVADAAIAPLAVGDGAVRFRETFEAAGLEVAAAGSRTHVVRGLSICRLAATVEPAPIEAVLPAYLRQPDAKPRTA